MGGYGGALSGTLKQESKTGLLFDLSLLSPVSLEKRHPKGSVKVFQSAPKYPVWSESLVNWDFGKSVLKFDVFCNLAPGSNPRIGNPGSYRARNRGWGLGSPGPG
jgi:hypothetical protein